MDASQASQSVPWPSRSMQLSGRGNSFSRSIPSSNGSKYAIACRETPYLLNYTRIWSLYTHFPLDCSFFFPPLRINSSIISFIDTSLAYSSISHQMILPTWLYLIMRWDWCFSTSERLTWSTLFPLRTCVCITIKSSVTYLSAFPLFTPYSFTFSLSPRQRSSASLNCRLALQFLICFA